MQLNDASNFVSNPCNHRKGPYNPTITDTMPFPFNPDKTFQNPGGYIKYRVYCECGAYCTQEFIFNDSNRHTFVLRADRVEVCSETVFLIVKLYTIDALGCGNEAANMQFIIDEREWEQCALSV